MAKINRTNIALTRLDENLEFADANLRLETILQANDATRKVAALMKGTRSLMARKLERCLTGTPCDISGCPRCDRYRRMDYAKAYDAKLKAFEADGARLYAFTAIPRGSMYSGHDLTWLYAYQFAQMRDRYRKAVSRHLADFKTFTFMAADISCHKEDGEDDKPSYSYCLHLHGVLAVWGAPESKSERKAFKGLLTEKLVAALNPDCEVADIPVVLKPIRQKVNEPYYNLASWITYCLKSRFTLNGSFGKKPGLLLGLREVPIRTFLSRLTYRSRIVEVRTHGKKVRK